MKIKQGLAVALTAAILASGGGVASLATAQPAQAASSQPEIDAAINQILRDTNAERAKMGLAPLKLAPSMNSVAQNWTVQMANEGSMYHNPNYQFQLPQPWLRVGENVAYGYNPSTVTTAWMNSEGHRKNILGNFNYIGLGYYVDANGRAWFTQNFGLYETPNLTEINEPTNDIGKFEFTSSWEAKWDEPVDNYRAELYSPEGVLLDTVVTPNPTVTFSGLSDLTTYTVKVVSQKTDVPGTLHTSPVKTYTVTTLEELPTVTAPANLAVSADETELTASWATPTDYIGQLQPYKVELIKGGVVVDSVETAANEHTFTGLTTNSDYSVNVTAVTTKRTHIATAASTGEAKTLPSSVAHVTEPTNLAAQSESHSTLAATWAAPAEQIGYNLKYIVTLSTEGKPDVVVETSATDYVFTGLKQNTAYSVTVQANITAENGVNQRTTTGVTTTAKTLIDYNAVEVSAPTLHPVEIAPRSANVSWSAPENVVGNIVDYTVTVKQDGQPDRLINTTATTLNVTDLKENVAYTFSVTANAESLNGANRASAVSGSATHTTPYAPDTVIVSAPNSVNAKAPTYSEVTATWAAPTTIVGSVTGYKVTLKEGNKVVSEKVVTSLEASFTGLSDYTDYTVEVVALATSADKTNNTASSSASSTVKTPVHVSAPNAPTNFKADTVNHDSATVSWTAPTGYHGTISDYAVIVREEGKNARVLTTKNTNFTVTGLTELTPYTIHVVAIVVGKDGVTTANTPHANLEVTTKISPSTVKVNAPTNVALSEVAYDSMKATWKAPTDTIGDVYGYQVTVKDGEKVVSSKFSFMTSANISGLTDSTNYTVEVVALASSPDKTNNASSAAASATAKTPAHIAAPNAPTNLTASNVTDKTAQLSWDAPTGVYGNIVDYTVLVQQDGAPERSFKVTGTTAEIAELSENSAYNVAVFANVVSRDGSLSATSPMVRGEVKTPYAADSVKVSPVAELKLSDVTENSLNINWNAPADVVGKLTGYTVSVKQGDETVKTFSTTATSQAVTGLKSNTPYTVEVKANAVSANGLKEASSVATVASNTLASSAVQVSAPVARITGTTDSLVGVTWGHPTNVTGTVTGFKVVVKNGSTVVKTVEVEPNHNAATITGLEENTDYTVTVEVTAVAENGVNTAKNISDVQSFKTAFSEESKVVAGTPVALVATSKLNSVTANWLTPAVTGKLTDFTVTLKQGNTVIDSYKTVATTATFEGLKEGTSYTVSVVANATSINGKYSATSNVTSYTVSTKGEVKVPVPVVPAPVVPAPVVPAPVVPTPVTPPVTKPVTPPVTKPVTPPVRVTPPVVTFPPFVPQPVTPPVRVTPPVVTFPPFVPQPVETAPVVGEESRVSVSAPTALKASATDNKIVATWEHAAVEGRFTSYTVSLVKGGKVVKTIHTTGTRSTFSGLDEKSSYTVYVKANAVSLDGKNAAVSGAKGVTVRTATSKASQVDVSAPAKLTAGSTKNTVTAAWKKPEVTGKVTSYTVSIKKGNETVATYYTAGTKVTFYGLNAGTEYTVSVKANATSTNGKFRDSSDLATKSITTQR